MSKQHKSSDNGPHLLHRLAAQTIGENAGKIGLEAVRELPTSLLAGLAWFLCASDLLQLHDFLTGRGINLEPVWVAHVEKLWLRKLTFWRGGEDPDLKLFKEEDAKELFCHRSFLNFLEYEYAATSRLYEMCTDSFPHVSFFTPLHQKQRTQGSWENISRQPSLYGQKQSILLPLCQNLRHLTVRNDMLSMLVTESGPQLEALHRNTKSIRVLNICKNKGIHAMQFLLQAMSKGSLKALGLFMVEENDLNMLLLLLVCSGILSRGPEAVPMINHYLSKFTAENVRESKPLLEQIHNFLYPPRSFEAMTDVSDDDSDPESNRDLFDEALQPLNSMKSFRGSHFPHHEPDEHKGKDERHQSRASLPRAAGPVISNTSLQNSGCFCPLGSDEFDHESPRTSGLPTTGLEAFALNRICGWSPRYLELCFSHWTSLRKLHLCHMEISCKTVRAIVPMVERAQLNHLVLDTIFTCRTLPARIINALVLAQNGRTQTLPVLHHLNLTLEPGRDCHGECDDIMDRMKDVTFAPMHGVEVLVLNMDILDGIKAAMLCAYLTADQSILDLTISPIMQEYNATVSQGIISILADKANLTKVDLMSMDLNSQTAQGHVVDLVRNNPDLQSLTIRSTLVNITPFHLDQHGQAFIDQILLHPSLQDLNLKSSTWGETSYKILETVLSQDTVLEKLELMDTGLLADDLLILITQMQSKKKGCRSTKLKYLDVGFIGRVEEDREALRDALKPLVDVICFGQDYERPYDHLEYLAMM